MYNLYGNKTIQKLAELFMLSLYVHQKTQFGVSFETWGHCDKVTLIIGEAKGKDFIKNRVFRSEFYMKKWSIPGENKLEKAKYSSSMAALRKCLKEKKVTIKLARSMDRLNKKMEEEK